MPNMVTIAEAAETMKCTKANIYQQIKKHGIETEKRTIQMLMAYTTLKEVQHVDLDDLKRLQPQPAELLK